MGLYDKLIDKPSAEAALKWNHDNPDTQWEPRAYCTETASKLERAALDNYCNYTKALYLEDTFSIAVLTCTGKWPDDSRARVRYTTPDYAGIITVAVNEKYHGLLDDLQVDHRVLNLESVLLMRWPANLPPPIDTLSGEGRLG